MSVSCCDCCWLLWWCSSSWSWGWPPTTCMSCCVSERATLLTLVEFNSFVLLFDDNTITAEPVLELRAQVLTVNNIALIAINLSLSTNSKYLMAMWITLAIICLFLHVYYHQKILVINDNNKQYFWPKLTFSWKKSYQNFRLKKQSKSFSFNSFHMFNVNYCMKGNGISESTQLFLNICSQSTVTKYFSHRRERTDSPWIVIRIGCNFKWCLCFTYFTHHMISLCLWGVCAVEHWYYIWSESVCPFKSTE